MHPVPFIRDEICNHNNRQEKLEVDVISSTELTAIRSQSVDLARKKQIHSREKEAGDLAFLLTLSVFSFVIS